MRTADADILIIPGWSSSGPDHWQTRWEKSLKTARRVEQADWFNPDRDAWVAHIHTAIAASTRPVILVAHSLGVIATVHALQALPAGLVAGAFLVAPADIENADQWPVTEGQRLNPGDSGFAPVPMAPLHCPSAMVASATDPYCSLERAKAFAGGWGSHLFEAGDVGHINTASGHGPWPDGLMQFGWFLRRVE
jgi:uncharacterized protein